MTARAPLERAGLPASLLFVPTKRLRPSSALVPCELRKTIGLCKHDFFLVDLPVSLALVAVPCREVREYSVALHFRRPSTVPYFRSKQMSKMAELCGYNGCQCSVFSPHNDRASWL